MDKILAEEVIRIKAVTAESSKVVVISFNENMLKIGITNVAIAM